MVDAIPTPEDVAKAQAVIQASMLAESNRKKAEAEAIIGPLIEAGLGTDQPLNMSVSELVALMDRSMPAIRDFDRGLYSSLEHSIIQLNNVVDRIKTIGSQFT